MSQAKIKTHLQECLNHLLKHIEDQKLLEGVDLKDVSLAITRIESQKDADSIEGVSESKHLNRNIIMAVCRRNGVCT